MLLQGLSKLTPPDSPHQQQKLLAKLLEGLKLLIIAEVLFYVVFISFLYVKQHRSPFSNLDQVSQAAGMLALCIGITTAFVFLFVGVLGLFREMTMVWSAWTGIRIFSRNFRMDALWTWIVILFLGIIGVSAFFALI